MTKARDLANIISGGFTEADIPNLSASKITSGQFANSLISSSAVSQHATSFDDNKIVNDISTLGLRVHTQENLNASNTSSASFDVFQDSSGISNLVTTQRNTNEYVNTAVDGSTKILNKAAIYANSTAYAVWQFRASNNASSWTNLGNTMDVSGGSEVNSGTFSNTTAYRYYEFYKTSSAQGGQYHRRARLYEGGSEISYTGLTASSGRLTQNDLSVSNLDNMFDGASNSGSSIGFHTDSSGAGAYFRIDFSGIGDPVTNATGSFTGNNITASSSTNKMGAVITYQDAHGTNTLNTDIVLQLSADGGSNYSTATMTALPDFATGIKMAKVNDLSVTAGTSINYKISFANQATGSKEARIRGVSLQY